MAKKRRLRKLGILPGRLTRTRNNIVTPPELVVEEYVLVESSPIPKAIESSESEKVKIVSPKKPVTKRRPRKKYTKKVKKD
jgi:hypothetical protein